MASVLNEPYFHDEAAAFEALEAIVWPNGPVCPRCGGVDRLGRLNGVGSEPSKKNPEVLVRRGLWKCYPCKGQFTARKGTVFESSHLELRQWLQAAYLMCSSKKGVSSNQLARTLGITVKSAWFASHRLREAMRDGGITAMGGSGKIVDADETFIGRKKGFPKRPGTGHKIGVMSLVERGGKVRSTVLDNVTRYDVERIIRANVHKESKLMTDTAAYYKAGNLGTADQMVNHFAEEWVRGEGHTNTLEGYYTTSKRGMKGIYQHCGQQHLHRYVAEFDFRNNHRIRLGTDDKGRTAAALRGIVGND
jgi:transposase-like protein